MGAREQASEGARVLMVVVSWNTRELLGRCLDAVRSAVDAGWAEVWVVDNASEDGSAELVADAYPWVHLLALDTNVGFGPAVNQVAEQVAGPAAPGWIAPANADVALLPGALETLLDAGAADPRAGVLAPALVLDDGSLQHSAHPFPGVLSALAVNLNLARLLPGIGRRLTLDGLWDRTESRQVDWAHGAFLLVRRRAFDAVGGFSPDQFLYAEDLDLGWRLARRGWHTRYVPQARARHAQAAATTQRYGDRRDVQAQHSADAWMLRRRGAAVMRTYALINTTGAFARAIAALPAALGGDAAARQELWRQRRAARMHLASLRARRQALWAHR